MSDSFNILHYMYFFNGGGIAAGDLDNDGLVDLYFTGNQVSGKLYHNQGRLRFQDITSSSGTETRGWGSGVSMVDINGDGWLDIYVCQTGYADAEKRRNLLFINQGDLTFEEQASRYGLDDPGYSTQAAFFDADRDGDPDVYILNHTHQWEGNNAPTPIQSWNKAPHADRFYECTGIDHGIPQYAERTEEKGLTGTGFGLGISIGDLNRDLWPDVYISNDFLSGDLLFLNNGDGTFSNRIATMTHHQSHNGMGTHIADLNNDAWPDIVVADMLPVNRHRRLMMAAPMNTDAYDLSLRMGYQPQYMQNTLQINQGQNVPSGQQIPFTEIAHAAGIAATDWSWSALMADLDNNGYKDVFFTTGYYRDITNLDFIAYRKRHVSFHTKRQQDSLYLTMMHALPAYASINPVYSNDGLFPLRQANDNWGLSGQNLSHGAVAVDLDNDGDLELITNNLNAPSEVYENLSEQTFLTVTLKGPQNNPWGIGTQLLLYHQGQIQYQEQQTIYGYLSGSVGQVHFGLGNDLIPDSLMVIWPDGRMQVIKEPSPNQPITIRYEDALDQFVKGERKPYSLFTKQSQHPITKQEQPENHYNPYRYDRLAFRSYDHQGPSISKGDLNGDLKPDFYLGGARGFSGKFGIQQQDGTFRFRSLDQDLESEDGTSLWLDVDLDGDQDLYVTSSGQSHPPNHPSYQDRLYLNDGLGNFVKDVRALPEHHYSSATVVGLDYDRDGDTDLFVGGLLSDAGFPDQAPSQLLRNDSGVFHDVAATIASGLQDLGMITDAIAADYNRDGWTDLILVGWWKPVLFFRNDHGQFQPDSVLINHCESMYGWWETISGQDIDRDGDLDLVLGNFGENSILKASDDHPVGLYVADVDQNGIEEALLSHWLPDENGEWNEYPFFERDQILLQMPTLRKRFPSYQSFAEAKLFTFLDDIKYRHLRACQFRSGVLLNENSNHEFSWSPLPAAAQRSIVKDLEILDVNNDGIADIVGIGNDYNYHYQMGRQDASSGFVFLGNGDGTFAELPPAVSGWICPGNNRSLISMEIAGDLFMLVTQNEDRIQMFKLNPDYNQVSRPQ